MMVRCRQVLAVLLLVLVFAPVSGCWSRREIEDLAIVGAVALDAAPGDQVRLSVFISHPRTIAGGPSMGGGGGGQPQKVGEVVSATGSDFAEAARRLEELVPRRLFWAQNHVLIIGEELARRGLHYLDFFSRERQMRLTMVVLITGGEARQVLALPPGIELAPGIILTGIVRNRTTFKIELKDLLAMWEAPGDNPTLPRVVMTPTAGQESQEPGGTGDRGDKGGGMEEGKKKPPEVVAIKGAGAFRGDRLVGWLDEIETNGLMWLRGEVREGVITVTLPHLVREPGQGQGLTGEQRRGMERDRGRNSGQARGPGPDQGQLPGPVQGQGQDFSQGSVTDQHQGRASVNFHRIDTKTTARVEGEQLTFKVEIRGHGDLYESTANIDPDRQEHLLAIQEAVNREVTSRIQAAIHKAQQELRTDIFGFGEVLHRSNVPYWRQVRDRWNEEFSRAHIQVQVKLTLRRMGITNRTPGKTGDTGGKGATQGAAR